MFYTGVGSRKTPIEVCDLMTDIAKYLRICLDGVLRSGHAEGADMAFENGAATLKEIYKANDSTPEAEAMAASYHPNWKACTPFARKLHGRNMFQVLGKTLNLPSTFLICWTPDGCTSQATRKYGTGGTGTAISVADAWNIKIYNLKNGYTFQIWKDYVEASKAWVELQIKLQKKE